MPNAHFPGLPDGLASLADRSFGWCGRFTGRAAGLSRWYAGLLGLAGALGRLRTELLRSRNHLLSLLTELRRLFQGRLPGGGGLWRLLIELAELQVISA